MTDAAERLAEVQRQRDDAMGWRRSLTDQCLALQAQRDALAERVALHLAHCAEHVHCEDCAAMLSDPDAGKFVPEETP
jgi:hypothetical protein